MANNIATAKKYIPVLDAIYQAEAKSTVLDGAPELAREGANAGELLVAKMTLSSLADYNKTTGYASGDVTLEWETIKADYDRGRMFSVDNVENADAADLAFGQLANEFIRTKVAPELDAVRFNKYASTAGVGTAAAALTTGDQVVKALRVATNEMDEGEVPMEDRILFITPTLKGLIDDLDTSKSKAVLDRFSQVVEVPQARFMKGVTLSATGFTKTTTTGKDLNFLVIHKAAAVQYPKHVAPKIVTPEQNQVADAWKFGYRIVGVCQAYENKVKGIYAHTVA